MTNIVINIFGKRDTQTHNREKRKRASTYIRFHVGRKKKKSAWKL